MDAFTRPGSKSLSRRPKKDVQNKVMQMGKEAAQEVDVRGLNNKIITMLGALHYRTSYGQNVLRHSVEVAFLAQVMAELNWAWMVPLPSGRPLA